MIKLFDIQNGKIVPTEHCYSMKSLKTIMDKYPDDHLSIYAYLFYMTCPNPEYNPFFNAPQDDKEEIILSEVDAKFDPEAKDITDALDRCKELYETPTVRAFKGIKSMLDRLANYMATTNIEHGRDGNINSLVSVAKNYEAIRNSFKGAYKDLMDEQDTTTRGGQDLAYDQR